MLYDILNISRQAVYKNALSKREHKDQSEKLIKEAMGIPRQRRGRIGCRKIAGLIKRRDYGRDKTEQPPPTAGFIIDVYTRLITGYNVSDTLKASENIKAPP